MTDKIDTFDLSALGRTIKLVEKFETMPESTWDLCKAILCCEPPLHDPVHAVINAVWDIGYIAHVMDAISHNRAYGITTYITD